MPQSRGPQLFSLSRLSGLVCLAVGWLKELHDCLDKKAFVLC